MTEEAAGGLDMWTIYAPELEDGAYVAKCWNVAPGGQIAQLTGHTMSATSLPLLRKMITFMTGCDQVFVRQEGDEPNIVETWL